MNCSILYCKASSCDSVVFPCMYIHEIPCKNIFRQIYPLVGALIFFELIWLALLRFNWICLHLIWIELNRLDIDWPNSLLLLIEKLFSMVLPGSGLLGLQNPPKKVRSRRCEIPTKIVLCQPMISWTLNMFFTVFGNSNVTPSEKFEPLAF